MPNNTHRTLATRFAATEPRVKVIYVSTYPPRECGIATYTRSLVKAVNLLNPEYLADIIAIDDEKSGGVERNYPWEVKYKIDQQDLRSWMSAADYINQSGAEVVNLQHEFGIYGGREGEYVIPLMEAVKKPIVVSLHTVLPDPEPKMVEMVKRMGEMASAITVVVHAAADLLVERYGVCREKIVVIPHGVPDIPFNTTHSAKKKLGLDGWEIISSFGLMSSSKGYEYLINSMPAVLASHPQAKLILLGETHPVVLRHEGEKYRESLQKIVKDLGIEKNVQFENKYLTLDEIVAYLQATDVYVTPYPNLAQVSSGTLSYALAAGKPCVSTPYVYAKEVLADGRGELVDELTSAQLSTKINNLLSRPKKRLEMARRAYDYGRNMTWPHVALNHLDLFEIIAREKSHELQPA